MREMTTELIAKLENGSGEDQELEALILCKLAAPTDAYVEQSKFNGRWCIYHGADRGGQPRLWEDRRWSDHHRLNITSSLDAALSLVERMLPGAQFNLTNLYGVAAAELPLNGGDDTPWETGRHKGGDLPRAILVALLRSLETRKDGKP
jgi:hypothetical protein